MNRLTTPWRELDLARFPYDPRDPLRAWDAADEYLLRRLAGGTDEEPVDLAGRRVTVLGDRWGALSAALAEHTPALVTDSWLAHRATAANLERNGLAPDAVRVLTTREAPPERIDVLLVRVPKTLSLLEDQLHRLAPALHSGSVVLGTGMVKDIHTSTLRLFERLVGPTRTGLAWRKARLITATYAGGPPDGGSPWPLRWAMPPETGALAGRRVTNHAGVFCADRLDVGTRFLLAHLPHRHGPEHVVDLGCGNGIVGLAAALDNPAARVTFTDESYQALASAEETFRANAPAGTHADFLAGDGVAGLAPGTADVVLNNPPFHSHQATTTATARRMFAGAREALRPGGELYVVANRHLGHHLLLRRIFGACELVAGDPKFVVLRATRR